MSRNREAYSDDAWMYRTALKTGNLHNLMGKRNMRTSNDIVTGEFDTGFVHLASTEEIQGTDTGKYSIQMRFKNGSEALKELESALEKFDEMNGEGWSPLKVGQGEYDDGYVIVKAKTQFQPICKNVNGELIDAGAIRKGDKCRAIIKFGEFNSGSMKGNTIFLQKVQRIADSGTDFPAAEDSDLPF